MDTTRREFMAGTVSLALPIGARGASAAPSRAMLGNVNTTDIASAIMLGCGTMGRVFDPADNDIPFFESRVRPTASLGFNPSHSEAHVPGRHLNALLHAEHAIGVEVPDEVIEKHARAAFFSYSGALPLPLNRDRIGGTLNRFLPHNLREGFHALYALARYRDSAKARALAERSIAAIFDLWRPDTGWNRQRLEDAGVQLIEWPRAPFITGIARAIGPLVKYHAATRHEPALRLALALKDKAVAECFLEDGSYASERLSWHTHSTTCVMSSLAQLADLTRDAALMTRVKSFFDRGLTQLSDEIGWCTETTLPKANPDKGEANNSGDILETALILARWGHPEYHARAELILRGHLLPCQLRDTSFIPKSPMDDSTNGSIAERHLGAFGFPAPYGHQPVDLPAISFNMDIVGGAVDSLCAAHQQIATIGDDGCHVNLLFDHETELLKIASPYAAGHPGRLRITPKRAMPLFVRMPPWVRSPWARVDGRPVPATLAKGYLAFGKIQPGQVVTIGMPLVRRDLVLRHRTRDIRVRLQGDRITAMDNFGTDLTFFPPIA